MAIVAAGVGVDLKKEYRIKAARITANTIPIFDMVPLKDSEKL